MDTYNFRSSCVLKQYNTLGINQKPWINQFDNFHWNLLFEILKEIGIDCKDRKIIHNLYKNQIANAKVNNSEYKQAIIKKGVGQGCNLSPYLFNI